MAPPRRLSAAPPIRKAWMPPAVPTDRAAAENEDAFDWAATVELFGGVLARLGDVMGTGALHSLMRYGALEEGARLGARLNGRDAEAVLKMAGRLLHLDVRLDRLEEGVLRVRVRPPSYLKLAKGGSIGLVAGLFEGILSSTQRTKYELSGEAQVAADGELNPVQVD